MKLSPKQRMKRTQILAAATNIFIENGFDGTNVDAIVDAIGGSKSTVYRFFGNKEGLFQSVGAYISERSNAILDAAVSELNKEPVSTNALEEDLTRFASRYLKSLLAANSYAPIRSVVRSSGVAPDVSEAFFDNGPVRAARLLAEHFQSWTHKGLLAIDHPQITAEQFLGMLRSNAVLKIYFVSNPTPPSDEEIDSMGANAVKLFLYGVVERIDPSGQSPLTD